MAERFKAPVLKTGRGASLSWVRIPPLPPLCLFPWKFERQKRTGVRSALSLTIAVAFVGELQAKALRILLQAARHSPGAIGTALPPAPIGGPDRLSPLAARERQLSIVRVISPRRHATVAGVCRADAHRARNQSQVNDRPKSRHTESAVERHDTAQDTATGSVRLPGCYSA